MAYETTKNCSFKFAFVLDEALLRRITLLFSSDSDEIKYRLECSEGSSISAASLQEVIEFPNSKSRKIRRLWIETGSNSSVHSSICFRDEDRLGTIEYSLRGPDDKVRLTSEKLEDYILDLREWYSSVATLDLGMFFFSCYIFFCLLMFSFVIGPNVFGYFWKAPRAVPQGEWLVSIWILIIAKICLFWFFFVCQLLYFLRKPLFPVGVFLIGDGEKRHKGTVLWRKFIFVTLLFPFLWEVARKFLLRR